MRIADQRRAAWLMSDAAFEGNRHQVRVDGAWLDVVEMGEGDPIVLAPGLAGGWKLLIPLARVLSRWHRVILFNYRDEHDTLTARPAESLGDYVRDLNAVIGAMRLERPTVFGVSFGAAVALEYAIEFPQRCGALILSGVEARFRTTMGSTVARRVLERFPLPIDNPFVNQFFNLLHAGKPAPGPLPRFVIERCWETNQAIMARRLSLLDGFDVSERLWNLDQPTMILAGSRDVIVPHARQKALASLIPDCRFETLDAAGHIGFLTHAADVAQHVERLHHAFRPSFT
ncbi:alpha/beta fold hydrolase [Tundrisphaera sp. TA3]|uniref:alpha/beta fold hydrolase n=1 Tax=Tundrisphaera sp. TA3 TaxID=3435775 RepID=UPI003EBD4804